MISEKESSCPAHVISVTQTYFEVFWIILKYAVYRAQHMFKQII